MKIQQRSFHYDVGMTDEMNKWIVAYETLYGAAPKIISIVCRQTIKNGNTCDDEYYIVFYVGRANE